MAEEENKLNVKHHVYLKATSTLHTSEFYSIQKGFITISSTCTSVGQLVPWSINPMPFLTGVDDWSHLVYLKYETFPIRTVKLYKKRYDASISCQKLPKL